MDHDTEVAACAACDVTARLQSERKRARRELRAVELLCDNFRDAPPALLAQQLGDNRRALAAIDRVLGDMLAYGGRNAASA
ncbi:MAG: hypothetical protein ABL997_09300 [Planctomycetota bacterium]